MTNIRKQFEITRHCVPSFLSMLVYSANVLSVGETGLLNTTIGSSSICRHLQALDFAGGVFSDFSDIAGLDQHWGSLHRHK